jgi:uncharacterized protein (TIGR02246 family)
MPIHLPDVVREYFEADKSSNPDAIAQCFAEDAVVIDEGNTYTGREAIRHSIYLHRQADRHRSRARSDCRDRTSGGQFPR